MSKGMDQKKNQKKKAAKTPDEKRAAKKAKKAERSSCSVPEMPGCAPGSLQAELDAHLLVLRRRRRIGAHDEDARRVEGSRSQQRILNRARAHLAQLLEVACRSTACFCTIACSISRFAAANAAGSRSLLRVALSANAAGGSGVLRSVVGTGTASPAARSAAPDRPARLQSTSAASATALRACARDRRAIDIRRIGRRHLELQCRVARSAPSRWMRAFPARPASSADAARIELDEVHLLATAEQAAEQRERRGGDLGDEPHERLPDERSHAELRIVEAAASWADRCR